MATCDAPEVFQPLQAEDPSVVAGYRLAARLGAGGMGRVYLSHTQGGRPVAIKVVRPELADDPAFRRRFRREMEAARRVRGAYTAELIDGDADGAPPWLATLYVPGPSLAEVVARGGALPVPAVLWLMAGVAEALQAIHGAGIVHRDLKPSNVLLASDGPRVIDFGISLAAGVSSYTATGSTIGTPQFMAPEQASGGTVTAATDVFALGQTAAFAALGEPLYGDGPAVSVLYRIVHSEPDLSLLPTRLRPLIARCLAADPAERATLAEVVEWCRQQLGGDADAGAGPTVWREVMGPEVTVPPPVPDPTPAHAAAGRHRAAAGAGSVGGADGPGQGAVTNTRDQAGHGRGRDGGRAGTHGPGVDGHGRDGRVPWPGRWPLGWYGLCGGGRSGDDRGGVHLAFPVRLWGEVGDRWRWGGQEAGRGVGSSEPLSDRTRVDARRTPHRAVAGREELTELQETGPTQGPQGGHPFHLREGGQLRAGERHQRVHHGLRRSDREPRRVPPPHR